MTMYDLTSAARRGAPLRFRIARHLIVRYLIARYRLARCLLVALMLLTPMRASAVSAPDEGGVGGVPTPPATYYGAVLPGGGFAPAVGMSVVARIDGKTCGQSATTANGSQVVYSVDVVGEGPGGIDGCGAAGRPVLFQVAGRFMAPIAPWENSQVHALPLQPMQPPLDPHASIKRSGEALALSWLVVTLDTAGKATLVTGYRVWRAPKPYFDPTETGCDCVQIADVSGLTYTDFGDAGADVVGDISANYSYIVKAVNAVGESASSNRVGEFDFSLAPGIE